METNERLFLGLHLDPLFHAEIVREAERLQPLFPGQKWVQLRFFHFTVHFLGDTTASQKDQVIALARKITAETKPFSISLEGMGAFPDLKNPRVIWVGAAQECRESLTCFRERLAAPLIEMGFPREYEKFTPHATLFRVRAEKPVIWDEKVFRFPKTQLQVIDRLHLFKSILTPQGSEYTPCESFPFAG